MDNSDQRPSDQQPSDSSVDPSKRDLPGDDSPAPGGGDSVGSAPDIAADAGSDAQPAGPDAANSSDAASGSDRSSETSDESASDNQPADNARDNTSRDNNTDDNNARGESGNNSRDKKRSVKKSSSDSGSGKSRGGGGGGGASRNCNKPSKPSQAELAKLFAQPLLLVKFGQMRRLELFNFDLPQIPPRGTKLVIRSDRGVELGELLTALIPTAADKQLSAAKDNPANPADSEEQATAEAAPTDGDVAAADQQASAPDSESGGSSDSAQQTSAADCDCRSDSEDDSCEASCCSSEMIGSTQLREMIINGTQAFAFAPQNQVMRIASAQDISDQEHLDTNTREKKQFCRRQAEQLGLKMRISSVEHLLGGERIIFYFTSDARVDFRELVRRLASQYRTRIEMRQIGARDEARLIADYERCGRHCCCQSFLGELQPVSIRMAKVQKATLDPSKISGRCNRLMCCLCYEDQTYEQLRRKLPKRNLWISTGDIVGRVIDTQIITQLVRVIDTSGAMQVVNNEDIIKRNLPEAPEPTPTPKKAENETDDFDAAFADFAASDGDSDSASAAGDSAREDSSPADGDAGESGKSGEPSSGGESGKSGQGDQDDSQRKSRRRRRPRGTKSSQQRSSRGGRSPKSRRSGRSSGGKDSSQNSGGASGSPSPKRRRRRRKPRDGGENGPSSGGSGGGGTPSGS